jgi:hypothetical protein
MTKKELIEAIQNIPDDYKIMVSRPYDGDLPGFSAFLHDVIGIENYEQVKMIELIVDDEEVINDFKMIELIVDDEEVIND